MRRFSGCRNSSVPRPSARSCLRCDQQALHPPQQRMRIVLLRLHVDGFVVILGIDDDRQVEPLRIGAGKAGVAVAAPLHGRAHAVAVAQVEVVAHADFVAVVNHRRSRQRKQQGVHQLDAAAVVFEQRGQAPANAQVDAHVPVLRVDAVHVIALFVGHHFERQLVVVAQEQRPLAVVRDRRRQIQDVGHRVAVFHADGHEQARHEREVEGHVAFVARAEIGDGVLRPLVGLRQQHLVLVAAVDVGAQLAQERVGLGQVLAVGALALIQVGHGVQAQAVHSHVEPEIHRLQHGRAHVRAVEIEVRLVRVEAVPIIRFGHRVPGPVGGFEILEDDARFVVALRGFAPHVEIAPSRVRRRAPRALKPGVLVGGVVQHQLGDDAQAAAVRLMQESFEIAEAAVGGMDVTVIGDVVAVVAPRRGAEREQPDGGDAQVFQVSELLGQAGEIAHAVARMVVEGTYVGLVNDRVLEPEWVDFQRQR